MYPFVKETFPDAEVEIDDSEFAQLSHGHSH